VKLAKTIDCVAMKAEIQERLLREVAEFGEDEARRRRAERLSRDPVLGRFAKPSTAPKEHIGTR